MNKEDLDLVQNMCFGVLSALDGMLEKHPEFLKHKREERLSHYHFMATQVRKLIINETNNGDNNNNN